MHPLQSLILRVIPQCKTMNELLTEYINLYGKNTLALSTYAF